MTKGGTGEGQKTTMTNVGSAELDKKPKSQCLEGLEARFVRRCEVDLCLDEKTSSKALKIFKESKPLLLSSLGTIGTSTVDETERIWHACILFAVKRLSNATFPSDEKAEEHVVGFTLSQILKTTKLSLLEFFKELPQVLAKVGPNLENAYGGDWEKRLMVKEFQADFYYLTVLFNYYKRVYQNLFLPTEGECGAVSGLPVGTNEGGHTSVHMRFGWMLFLVLRMRVLSQFVDLIIMILHMPPGLRKFSFDTEDFFKKRTADGSVKIVASLCALYYDASEEDVSKMVEKASRMICDLLKKTSGLRTRSRAEQLAGIDTENLVYFEGLMDERSIISNMRIVEKVYEEVYLCRGELDERMFINGDEILIGATSTGTPTSSGSKRKFEAISSSKQLLSASTGACPSSPSSPKPSSAKSSSVVSDSRMPPPTPVTVTLSTAKWLRLYISPLSSEPTAELHIFLRSCDKDISSDVTRRAQVLFEKIFATDGTSKSREVRGTKLLDSAWVQQRRLEATKLYYRVLYAMCRAESQRLGNKNLTALLTNERFHRCMIACSAELVLYTHKTVTMTFPAILEPTGITAFDLSKVTEYFVRHEDTLPKELKRHLNSMEQQILESMAWEKGSSMYNALIVAKKNLALVINRLCLLADPMPALDSFKQHPVQFLHHELEGTGEGSGGPCSPQKDQTALPSIWNVAPTAANENKDQVGNSLSHSRDRPSAFSSFTSPVKVRPPPLQSAFASPQRPSPLGGGETCAETVINVFFQKVLTLAYVRIKDLCDRLHQSSHVREQVYRTMKHIVYNETSLCFNRHIDQLILCSIYGVCKVNKANVTFRTCIEHYSKQPQCKRHVFCNVFIDFLPAAGEGKMRGPETGDIIKFYNQIFVPATKQYLVQLGENIPTAVPTNIRPKDEDRNEKGGSAPGSPRHSFPALPDMSPKKVSASHNVYVSPLRSKKMETLKSPHTRSLYACVGESTHAYQSPSKDLTAINNLLNNRRIGRLDFDGASLVSDSLVAGSLYPCPRSGNHHSVHLNTDSVLSSQSQPTWTIATPVPRSPLKRHCAES